MRRPGPPVWSRTSSSLREVQPLGPPAREKEDDSYLRCWNCYCQRDFNFSSAQLSTSLQCRQKGRDVSLWQDLPSSSKMEFVEADRGHFSVVSWGTFLPLEVQQKGIEATRP